MRGRKPTPTALKLLHNNLRDINPAEPQHAPLDPVCPSDLTDPVARAEWERVTRDLVTERQVTVVDRAVLMGYCTQYARWRALELEAAKHPFIVKAPSGYPIPNPAIGMANKTFGLMLKAAVELGITPSSRSRVQAATGLHEQDEFEQFKRGKPALTRVK